MKLEIDLGWVVAAAAIGVVGVSTLRPAAHAQTAALPAPTYSLTVQRGVQSEAWRLNARTGELDLCSLFSQPGGSLAWDCIRMPNAH